MKIAETVTFGGSGLDRAAELREKTDDLRMHESARAILFWRGKPMLADGALVRVAMDHAVMADAADDLIFLGLEDGAPVFAADLTGSDDFGQFP